MRKRVLLPAVAVALTACQDPGQPLGLDRTAPAPSFAVASATGPETRITMDAGSQMSPVISGDRIAFQHIHYKPEYGRWSGDNFVYDLAGGTEWTQITDGHIVGGAAVSGDRIVWTDYRDGNGDIYMYELSETTPEEKVDLLSAAVSGLIDAGLLDQGGNGLLGLLDVVLTSVQNDRPSTIKQLNAFINAVEGLINGGPLTAEQGQPLIDAAQSLIDQLSA